MKDKIYAMLTLVLSDMGIADVSPQLTRPEDPDHGDYTTNVAMVIAKKIGKKPAETAEIIQKAIIKHQKVSSHPLFAKVEVASPGFVNFFLSEANLINQINQVLMQDEAVGQGRQPRPRLDKPQNLRRNTASEQNVMIEFSDANPFKEFHIGHLRNITLGESFSRLLEATGHDVRRVSYQGDVGMHVAKALYGLHMSYKTYESYKSHATPKEKVELLGKAYARGAAAFEKDETAKQEIIEINKKIYRKDPSLYSLWEEGRQWSLDYFDTIYDRLGTEFKRFYFESEVAPIGAALVADHMKDGIFEESEGAVIFRGEKFGLHTRVFISKEGYATYEAKDLALASLKYSEYPYDLSIIMTANEQTDYFKVMLAALKLIRPDLAQKTRHISFGMVRLTTGKMASRKGNIITADKLIDEAKSRIREILQKSESKYTKIQPSFASSYGRAQQEEIAEKAAVAAVKYSMLKVTASSDIAFDLEKSVSFEGDSGPYLQYTYARARSVLRKAGRISLIRSMSLIGHMNSEEKAIARTIGYFPEIIIESAEHYAPNTLCTYLFQLAQAFNHLYAKHEIIGSDMRLALTMATSKVLKNGLFLLGIDVLENM